MSRKAVAINLTIAAYLHWSHSIHWLKNYWKLLKNYQIITITKSLQLPALAIPFKVPNAIKLSPAQRRHNYQRSKLLLLYSSMRSKTAYVFAIALDMAVAKQALVSSHQLFSAGCAASLTRSNVSQHSGNHELLQHASSL